jgi:hypothetical protein
MLPEKEQARKAIWNGIDGQEHRIIDQVFPKDLRVKTVDDEMRIEATCGSMWQVVGSDSYNSLVGANPVGVVFSEYAIGNPAAWDYIRPILAENGGWAIFPYTPRGRNHGHTLFRMAESNPDWFAEILTVDDTLIIPPEVIQAERDSGMDDDMIQQEYFCSWQGVRQGSIFGQAMQQMRASGRIGVFQYERRYPVNTFWDIGHSDATAIIFHQKIGARHRFIRAYENAGQDLAHFVGYMKDQGYLYGRHYLPHDAKNVTLSSKSNPLGKNVWDQLVGLGVSPTDLVQVPRTPDKWTAINATRIQLDTVEIDAEGCDGLISAMESYHKKWDDTRKCYSNDPVHDWSSNYADAVRQWAQGYTEQAGLKSFTQPTMVNGMSLPLPAVRSVGQQRVGY